MMRVTLDTPSPLCTRTYRKARDQDTGPELASLLYQYIPNNPEIPNNVLLVHGHAGPEDRQPRCFGSLAET